MPFAEAATITTIYDPGGVACGFITGHGIISSIAGMANDRYYRIFIV
jgi:hypothetical protein